MQHPQLDFWKPEGGDTAGAAASVVDTALRRASLSLAAVLCSCVLLTPSGPAHAEALSYRFKASRDPEIRAGQQTMVEAWAYINAYFVDSKFNGVPWDKALQGSLADSFKASSRDEVDGLTDRLVKRLDDPFTRVLRSGAARAFSAETEGNVIANGLSVAPDRQGRARVAFVAAGSPAEAAGVQVGDVVLAVNGAPVPRNYDRSVVKELNKEVDLRMLRTPESQPPAPASPPPSTAALAVPSVISPALKLPTARASASSPASSATPPRAAAGTSTFYALQGFYSAHLVPGPIAYSPVQYGTLSSDSVARLLGGSSGSSKAAGGAGGTSTPPALGYIKIVAFSATAPGEVRDAIKELQADSVGGFIVDLRDNGGGVVEAGVEIADMLLRRGDVFCVAFDRLSGATERVVLEAATDNVRGAPTVVLVNANTASTSELLAGALHDNVRPASTSIATISSAPTLFATVPPAAVPASTPAAPSAPPSAPKSMEEMAAAYAAALSAGPPPPAAALPPLPPLVPTRGPAFSRPGGALLLGERTFGKGRTQRVIALADGTSTLLVSTVAYRTPALTMVDHVGLTPDVVCRPGKTIQELWAPGGLGDDRAATSLLQDPCIEAAARRLAQQLAAAPPLLKP